MAAIDAIIRTLNPGDKVICGDDVYGGTYRLFTKEWSRFGLDFQFVDTTDPNLSIPSDTRLVWLETPTNPLLKTTNIEAVAQKSKAVGAMLVVDNTFATPVYQQPLTLGADVVLHSMTKYINGHSDVVSGVLVTNDDTLAERLCVIQFLWCGSCPDGLLFNSAGLKTLHVRMARHTDNAKAIAGSPFRTPSCQ